MATNMLRTMVGGGVSPDGNVAAAVGGRCCDSSTPPWCDDEHMTKRFEVWKVKCREQNLLRMCQKWEGKDEA
jgi:hypothetical protein